VLQSRSCKEPHHLVGAGAAKSHIIWSEQELECNAAPALAPVQQMVLQMGKELLFKSPKHYFCSKKLQRSVEDSMQQSLKVPNDDKRSC
jgi:hypothetical protein